VAHRVSGLQMLSGVVIGHGLIWVGLISVGTVLVLCGAVVVLVLSAERKDRVKAIEKLAPILERLAEGANVTRRRRK
jgi:amino acid transporter